MGLILPGSVVEPAARGLLGCISCSGAPTGELRRLLQAVLSNLWQRPDLRVSTLVPLAPGGLALELPESLPSPDRRPTAARPGVRRGPWGFQRRAAGGPRLVAPGGGPGCCGCGPDV